MRAFVLALALALTTAATPAPAQAAGSSTVLGETGGGPFGAAAPCGASLTGLQHTTSSLPAYQTSAAGVVTSFSYLADEHSGQVRALLFTRTTANIFQLVGKSETQAVVANTLNTFPTRIPVPAGALLGSRVTFPDMRCRIGARSSGDEIKFGTFDPDASSTFTATGSLAARWNISAVVESDADGDGYGDATQDLCPTSAATQAACGTPPPPPAAAPDTLVTKAPKKKSSKRKAKIVFASTVAGATFTCQGDTKPAKPCSSPFKKKVRYGKHTVVITATGPTGLVDPTPTVVKFKVKRPTTA